MKKTCKLFIILALMISSNAYCQSTWVPFTSPSPQAVDISLIESDNISVEFSAEVFGMNKTDTTVLNTNFNRISTPGGSVTVNIGHPEMPVIRQLIAIPHCTDVTISVNVTGTTSFTNYNIYPAPELVEVIQPDSSVSVEESFVYDTAAYLQNQNYPQVTAEIASTGYLRDQMYAEVFIYPVQFNPVTGNLSVNTNYELTLTFTNPSGPVNENTGIFNNVASNVFLNYASSGITAKINDRPGHTGDIEWIELTQQSQADDIVADYLIITDNIFWDPTGQSTDLLKIAQHRAEYNGFDIAIVEVDQVMNIFKIPGEDHEYERAIRRFIRAVYEGENAQNTYDGKLGYVLLVGDAKKQTDFGVPASYDPNPGAISPYPGSVYPSDYYYSCLTSNTSGTHDHVGDLFIGRFCCDDLTKLHNVVYKTIYYEREYQQNNAWKNKMGVFFGSNACNNPDYIPWFKNYLQNLVNQYGYSKDYFYYTDQNPYQDCINYLRNGSVFYYYVGHGEPEGWTDNQVSHDEVCQYVTNANKNQFVLSASCQSGHFDSQSVESFAERTMNCSEQRGFVGCIASGRNLSVTYGSWTGKPAKFKDYIFTSIWDHLSHVAGEFILEAKIATSGPNTYQHCIAFNYFGDPALNLMAEGFEITSDLELECPTTISSEIIVREGASLSIPRNCSVNFIDNGRIIVDLGGMLHLRAGDVITGINPQNAIDIYGNVQFYMWVNDPIVFSAPENHSWRGLSISNLSADVQSPAPLEFKNCSFTCHSSSLELLVNNGRNTFDNASFTFSHGSLEMNKTDFINSSVLVLDPHDSQSSVEISECTFNNASNVFLSSIFIERYKQYSIHDNEIEFSDGDGITIFNCGGITDNNFPNGITNNRIEYTGTSPNLHKGIKVYRGKAEISQNEIVNADYGIVGMNNSLITITGDEGATTYDATQQIVNNDSYQLHFTNNSFPEEVSYNVIGNGDDPDPLVYNDANPPVGTQFDVTLNCWDNHFNATNDLIPANQYDWTPIHCPTTTKSSAGLKDVGDDELIYASAILYIENGNYAAAQLEFKEIISDYPDTETAKSAVKQLFDLEPYVTNDYNSLITYYDTEPSLQNNNQLGKLSDWMISYCNVEIGEYQLAIDWYDNLIDTTGSEADSTFAAIDMGEAALAMGNTTKGSVQCKHTQFIFDNHKAFEINREYLINELLKSQKENEQGDPGLGKDRETGIAILHQNTPNPYNSTSVIKVEIIKPCYIELEVVDFAGKKVLTLAKANYPSGMHEFVVNSNKLNEGMYFYTLKINGINSDSKKMIIIN